MVLVVFAGSDSDSMAEQTVRRSGWAVEKLRTAKQLAVVLESWRAERRMVSSPALVAERAQKLLVV